MFDGVYHAQLMGETQEKGVRGAYALFLVLFCLG